MSIPKIASYPMPTHVDMPANRMSWQPDAARAVLLIHDMQDYFLDFFDRDATPVGELISNILRIRQACDAVGIPVVYTAQPAQQSPMQRGLLNEFWGPGVTAQPMRADVIAPLTPRQSDTVLTKWRYSAFARSDLLQRMRAQGRDQLIVCGVYAHIGCMLTCADAFMNDIQPTLVGDAVADFSLERHVMACDYVAQRCGVVHATAAVCRALGSRLPSSIEALRDQVALVLQMPASDLAFDDILLYAGLDSIRLMSLVEHFRSAGASVSFAQLGESPTLRQWWALFNGQS